MNRRGFLSRLLAGGAAVLAGSTPNPVELGLLPPPARPIIPAVKDERDRLVEFLLERWRKQEPFYMSGDLTAFLRHMSLGFKMEALDVTCYSDSKPRYIRAREEASLDLDLRVGAAFRFDLMSTGVVHAATHDRLISTDDLGQKDFVFYEPASRRSIIIQETRLWVRTFEIDNGETVIRP